MASATSFDTVSLSNRIRMLLLKNLIIICKDEGLAHSGVKSALQGRIIAQMQSYVHGGLVDRYNHLKRSIYNPETLASPQANRMAQASIPTSNHQSPSKSRPRHNPPAVPVARPTRLNFGSTAFCTIMEALSPISDVPPMEKNRFNVDTPLRLTKLTIDKLKADPTLRVMVYCAVDNGLAAYTKLDIAFPHQVELKVNLDEVKANLRGLKGKPGTTRPADITDQLHKTEKYRNVVSLCYALTTKRFHYIINLVKTHPVDELIDKLKAARMITKESVVREMVAKAQDPDLVTTSTIMSLKCPLSTLRMEIPCRSTVCTHVQCFDASSFLQLQQQAPTWMCPICNKAISCEALAVDQYVSDILKEVGRGVEQVTIEPNGKWSDQSKQSTPSKMMGKHRHSINQADIDDEDDDIIEISDIAADTLKAEATNPSQSGRTMHGADVFGPSSVAGSSTPSSAQRNPASSKRPASQVVDLTLSDSDDEPIRPPKRQQLVHPFNISNGGPVVRNGPWPG